MLGVGAVVDLVLNVGDVHATEAVAEVVAYLRGAVADARRKFRIASENPRKTDVAGAM